MVNEEVGDIVNEEVGDIVNEDVGDIVNEKVGGIVDEEVGEYKSNCEQGRRRSIKGIVNITNADHFLLACRRDTNLGMT